MSLPLLLLRLRVCAQPSLPVPAAREKGGRRAMPARARAGDGWGQRGWDRRAHLLRARARRARPPSRARFEALGVGGWRWQTLLLAATGLLAVLCEHVGSQNFNVIAEPIPQHKLEFPGLHLNLSTTAHYQHFSYPSDSLTHLHFVRHLMDLDLIQKPWFEGTRRCLRKEKAHAIVKRCLKRVYKDFRARWKHAEAVLIRERQAKKRERQDKNDHELLGLLPPPTAPPTMTKARRELAETIEETLWPDTSQMNACDEIIKKHEDIRVKLRQLDRDCTKLSTDLSRMMSYDDVTWLCVSAKDYGGAVFARSLLFNLITCRGSGELPEHFCIRRLYLDPLSCRPVLEGVELTLHTDVTLGRYCRDVMMEGKRKDADGSLYPIDIGPSQGKDGVERLLPRDIWHKIFKLLVDEWRPRDFPTDVIRMSALGY